MVCPKCANKKTRVYGTIGGLYTLRYRRCEACGHTFQTREEVVADPDDIEYVKYLREIGEYKDRTPSLFEIDDK